GIPPFLLDFRVAHTLYSAGRGRSSPRAGDFLTEFLRGASSPSSGGPGGGGPSPGKVQSLRNPPEPEARTSSFSHGHGRDDLADLAVPLRGSVDVLAQWRPLACPVAVEEILGQLQHRPESRRGGIGHRRVPLVSGISRPPRWPASARRRRLRK